MRNGTPEERFWRKVDRRGREECWEWKGNLYPNGYGQLRVGTLGVDRRMVQVHRFSFELHNGVVLGNSLCLHRCDNRKCVNPNHLYEGTAADNMRDRSDRGRAPSDTRSKLSPQKVQLARLLRNNRWPYWKIAFRFNVSNQAIRAAILGKSWEEVR
jgi:hypothetical protein